MTRLRLLSQPALLLLLVSTPATGQITVGLRAGASTSELAVTGIHIDDQDPHEGYAMGASVGVPLSSRLGIEIAATYIQRGSTATLLQVGDVDHRIQYLRLAALGKATAPLAGPFSLHVVGGPAVALEISCERETRFALQPIILSMKCNDPESNIKTKPIDLGLVGGGGFQFAPSDRIRLSMELLYTHGIRSILESTLDYTAANRSLEVHAGLDVPIG